MRYFRRTLSLWLLTTAVVAAQGQPLSLENILGQVEIGQYASALRSLDTRIAANANDVEARFLKGLVFMQQGDRQRAQAVFTEITELFPALPEAYNNLAALHVERGDYETAQRTLQEALEHTAGIGDTALLRSNLGDLYIAMAIDAYRRAQALNPDDPSLKAKLGYLAPMLD